MSSTWIWNDPELLTPDQLLPFFGFYETEPLVTVVKANVLTLTRRARLEDEVADATRSLAFTYRAMTAGRRNAPARVHRRSGQFQKNPGDVKDFDDRVPKSTHGRLATEFLASNWPICSETVLKKMLAAHSP